MSIYQKDGSDSIDREKIFSMEDNDNQVQQQIDVERLVKEPLLFIDMVA